MKLYYFEPNESINIFIETVNSSVEMTFVTENGEGLPSMMLANPL